MGKERNLNIFEKYEQPNKNVSLQIINGDCFEQLKILANKGIKASAVITSPPYNLGNNGYMKLGPQNNKYENYEDNLPANKWREWIEKIILQGLEVADYFYLNVLNCGSIKNEIHELLFNLKDFYCDKIFWIKGNGTPNGINQRVMTLCVEEIFIFSKANTRKIGTRKWEANVKNYVEISNVKNNHYSKINKATFPVELPKWIIENFTNPNELVIDCFNGTGTTGIACKETLRNYIGIEIDKKQCEISIERLK